MAAVDITCLQFDLVFRNHSPDEKKKHNQSIAQSWQVFTTPPSSLLGPEAHFVPNIQWQIKWDEEGELQNVIPTRITSVTLHQLFLSGCSQQLGCSDV